MHAGGPLGQFALGLQHAQEPVLHGQHHVERLVGGGMAVLRFAGSVQQRHRTPEPGIRDDRHPGQNRLLDTHDLGVERAEPGQQIVSLGYSHGPYFCV